MDERIHNVTLVENHKHRIALNGMPGRLLGATTLLAFVMILVTLLAGCLGSTSTSPAQTVDPGPTGSASHTLTPTQTSTSSPTVTSAPTQTPEPAWYQQIDESYSTLEYRYGLVSDPKARVYASLADAINQTGNFGYLPDAPGYVSVVGEETRNGNTYYTVYYGWMAAGDVQLLAPSTFRGILMTREVPFRFGWVLTDTGSSNATGVPARDYRRYDIVHEVPAQADRPGFFPVGADEWLPDEAVAVTSSLIPADVGPGTCRFLYVDLSEQTLRVYDQCKLVFATLVSTGKQAGWTFPGWFGITFKVPYIQLRPPAGSISVYYLEGVPNFMTYYGDLGFHGAYWHDEFGFPVSHGCVNLSPADSKWLYAWSWLGERVIISAAK